MASARQLREVFFEKGEFIRNRLYLGIDGRVSGAVKAGAFYLRRTQEKDDWAATHIVGLNLSMTPAFSSKPSDSFRGVIAQKASESTKTMKSPLTPNSTSPTAEPAGR